MERLSYQSAHAHVIIFQVPVPVAKRTSGNLPLVCRTETRNYVKRKIGDKFF